MVTQIGVVPTSGLHGRAVQIHRLICRSPGPVVQTQRQKRNHLLHLCGRSELPLLAEEDSVTSAKTASSRSVRSICTSSSNLASSSDDPPSNACSCHIDVYRPPLRNSSSCVPCSTTAPSRSTIIRSLTTENVRECQGKCETDTPASTTVRRLSYH
jgi:hypothetical protein